ncbi:MAG: LytR C-terminal domain-containing protein [Candidatus Marinimicrobia bacterium]|nr:LytR C-terminal domain-containing protein [Candidatus Neomarinimicrobiota bacterium]
MAQKKTVSPQSSKPNQIDIQRWLLNFAIVCIAVVIFTFMISSTKRFSSNSKKIDLSSPGFIPQMPKYEDVYIEVLNGCGITGMAGKYTEYLRMKGFDVLTTGNAKEMNYPETFILVRDTSEAILSPLLEAMSFSRDHIEFNPAMEDYITFRLILGKDCDRLTVFETIKNMENQF